MKAPTVPQRALALVRISDDREGAGVGVGRQEEDCRALAERLGWTLLEVIVENDTSAFKTKVVRDDRGRRRRVTVRPEFERVLDMLDSGQADGLVVYDSDRLARQPYDGERLIDIATLGSIPVASVTGSVDLSSDAGIAMSRIMVAVNSKSSADTSRRVKRAHVQQAKEGRPPGGWRAYGFEADRRTVIDSEATIIREVAERIIDGESLRSIRTDLDGRGVRPPHAAAWSTASLRSIVSKPMTAGLRTLHGEVVADGQWPAILDRPTWELVRAVLADEKRRTGTRGVDRHLLSGIARCGLCDAPMYVGMNGSRTKRYPVYKCSGCNRMSRSQAWLDDYVTQVVVHLLDREQVKAARRAQAGAKPGRTLTALSALKARRRELLRQYAISMSEDDITVMLSAVDEQIAELEGKAVVEVQPNLPTGPEFVDLPLHRRRAVMRRLVVVRVNPATRAGTANDPDSIAVLPAF